MTHRSRTAHVRWIAPPLAAALLLLSRSTPSAQSGVLTLSVPGRVSANVSMAARDATVVVAWSASAEAGADIYVAVSDDGGASFSEPRRANAVSGDTNPSGEQPPRVAIGEGTIHVVWPAKRGRNAIAYANSTDGGRTFSTPVDVPSGGLAGARGWASLAVAPEGAVHMVWLDGRAAAGTHVMGDGGADPQQDVYHASWRVGSKVVQERIADNVCFCCKTAVAVSGRQVFAAWRQIYPGSIRDIAFARSNDGGAAFRTPVRVSTDNWKLDGCPDDGPALAVDGRGRISVTWPTLMPGRTPRKAIFYASSRDGHRFTPRLRLDGGAADPAHPQIAMTTRGTAAVVWDEMANRTRRIMLRRITAADAVGPAEIVAVERGATYPAIAATSKGLLVAWTSGASDERVIRIQRLSR